jgi:hypothetical protein
MVDVATGFCFGVAVGDVVTVFVRTIGTVIVECSVTVTVEAGRDMISEGLLYGVLTAFIEGIGTSGVVVPKNEMLKNKTRAARRTVTAILNPNSLLSV